MEPHLGSPLCFFYPHSFLCSPDRGISKCTLTPICTADVRFFLHKVKNPLTTGHPEADLLWVGPYCNNPVNVLPLRRAQLEDAFVPISYPTGWAPTAHVLSSSAYGTLMPIHPKLGPPSGMVL